MARRARRQACRTACRRSGRGIPSCRASRSVRDIEQSVAATPGIEVLHRHADRVLPIVGRVQDDLVQIVAVIAGTPQKLSRIERLVLMRVARVQRGNMLAGAEKLVRRVDADIGEMIGMTRGLIASGENIAQETESSDFEILRAVVLLIGDPKIGRGTVDEVRTVGAHAHGAQNSLRERRVETGFGIEIGIPPGVSARTEDVAVERAIEDRLGARRRGKCAVGEGKTPHRQSRPCILHGWRVVDRQSKDDVASHDGFAIDGTDIGIIQAHRTADAVIGDLDEASQMIAIAAGDEKRDLVDRGIVVHAVVRRRRRRLILRGVEERGNSDERQRRRVLHGAQGVAAELELPSERSELRTEGADVAGGTRLTRL